MISRQLELGFADQPGLRLASRRGFRSSRANWWFERMRGVVDDARDWPSALPTLTRAPPAALRTGSVLPLTSVGSQTANSTSSSTGANPPGLGPRPLARMTVAHPPLTPPTGPSQSGEHSALPEARGKLRPPPPAPGLVRQRHPQPAPQPHRWRFSRARRLVWE
jgi:hypothetical protein